MKTMSKRFKRGLMAALLSSGLSLGAVQAAEDPAIDALEEYLMFVEYGGATIQAEQIPEEDWDTIHVVDTRDAGQYRDEHIPGAVNIEWRQVLDHRNELPRDRMVLVYCNSGTLSAQAGLALRLAGLDNVRILQGGMREWKEKGGFEANARAVEAASN